MIYVMEALYIELKEESKKEFKTVFDIKKYMVSFNLFKNTYVEPLIKKCDDILKTLFAEDIEMSKFDSAEFMNGDKKIMIHKNEYFNNVHWDEKDYSVLFNWRDETKQFHYKFIFATRYKLVYNIEEDVIFMRLEVFKKYDNSINMSWKKGEILPSVILVMDGVKHIELFRSNNRFEVNGQEIIFFPRKNCLDLFFRYK